MTTPIDVAILGARVMDPETGLDGVRDVWVSNGTITRISHPGETSETGEAGPPADPADPADPALTLDGRHLVLAPGFIDVHSHSHDVGGLRVQAMDGVTTALELELGLLPVETAYRRAEVEGRPVNFGFSAAWATARMLALGQIDTSAATMSDFTAHVGQPRWQREATRPEVDRIEGLVRDELRAGALGIGLMTAFAPGADPAEIEAMGRLAGEYDVPTYSHIRDIVEVTPDVRIDGAIEIARVGERTGAHMHFCHVHSVSTRHIDRVLGVVTDARDRGVRITTEAYPYGSGMTSIGAAFLTPEGLRARRLTVESLIFAATGERLTSERRLLELRASDPGGLVFVENLREDEDLDRAALLRALTFDDGIIASDAMPLLWPDDTTAALEPRDGLAWPLPPSVLTHPRTAGCFARALRQLARGGSLSLMEVLRRSSLLPALMMEKASPQLARKGRLQVGCDADLVLFDPAAVTDQATYAASTRTSTGIRAVLVGGTPVVADGQLQTSALPGRAIRGRAG